MNEPEPHVVPAERRSWPRRLINRLEVDRAVFYAILSRGWQFVAGPVTMVLIARFFTPELQGYYYTFWQLIALQTFFDLSLHQVLISFASHEWERLSLTPDRSITGDPDALSRLSSLVRGSLKWYGAGAILFFLVVGMAGLVFFAQGRTSDQLAWRAPWLALVGLTALSFGTTPCLAVLEGCNQVRSVYQNQFARTVLGNLVVWGLIPWGANLWVPAATTLVRLLCEWYLIAIRYRRFFAVCVRVPLGPRMDWRQTVWPFQWRVAARGLLAYFNTYLMTPIVFWYHGEAAAGQLGMTWQIFTSLEAACASWVKARTAQFGMLVARRDFRELDRIFFRLTMIASVVLAIGACAVLLFDVLLYQTGSRYAVRLLPPLPTALLALAMLLVLIPENQWTYIHAHKRSPHLLAALVGSLLSIGLIGGLGWKYGALGVTVAYLAVTGLYYLPVWSWVWWVCRAEWHAEPAEAGSGPTGE